MLPGLSSLVPSGGISTLLTTTTDTFRLAVSADCRAILLGNANGLPMVSGNGGSSFTNILSSGNWNGPAISADGRYQFVSDSNAGHAAVSQDFGASFAIKGSYGDWRFQDSAISDDGRYMMTCSSASAADHETYILRSTDYGASFALAIADVEYMQSLCCSSDGSIGFIGTNQGLFKRASSFFAAHTALTVPSGLNFRTVRCSASGAVVLAGTESAGVLLSRASGDGLAKLAAFSATAKARAIAVSRAGSILYVGLYGGGMYRSIDTGTTWQLIPGLPTAANWTACACSSDGSTLIAAIASGAVYRVET